MCNLKLMMAVAASALYRARYGVQEARESCTNGCTRHKDALKRTGRAAQTAEQSPTWCPGAHDELHRQVYRIQIGAQEARAGCTDGCTELNLAPRRPWRAAQTDY